MTIESTITSRRREISPAFPKILVKVEERVKAADPVEPAETQSTPPRAALAVAEGEVKVVVGGAKVTVNRKTSLREFATSWSTKGRAARRGAPLTTAKSEQRRNARGASPGIRKEKVAKAAMQVQAVVEAGAEVARVAEDRSREEAMPVMAVMSFEL